MNGPTKALISAKLLGKQLYILAHKLSATSAIASSGSQLPETLKSQVISSALLEAIKENPKIKDALLLEDIVFTLWIADMCLENKNVSKSMFSELIDDLHSREKPGTDVQRLSLKLRSIYIQRYTLYAAALEKDQKNANTGPMSELTEARILSINTSLPDAAKIGLTDVLLRFLFQTEWLAKLKCMQSTIAMFKIADGS